MPTWQRHGCNKILVLNRGLKSWTRRSRGDAEATRSPPAPSKDRTHQTLTWQRHGCNTIMVLNRVLNFPALAAGSSTAFPVTVLMKAGSLTVLALAALALTVFRL